MAVDRGAKTTVTRSLMTYQILLYLHGYYLVFFLVSELLLFIFKSSTLPYPPSQILAVEIVITLLLAAIDGVRIFFAKKGNLTETAKPLALSLAFSIPVVLGCAYLLLWQTFVLRAELILISIQLILVSLAFILGIIASVIFNAEYLYGCIPDFSVYI